MNLSGSRNQCQGCKEYFNSNTAFDKHRTGPYGRHRRCMTREEMMKKGMALGSSGFWVSEPMNGKPIWSKHESTLHNEDGAEDRVEV